MPLQRRTLLAVVNSAVTATAGCLGGSAPDGMPASNSPPATTATLSTTAVPPCHVETTLPVTDKGPGYPSVPTALTEASASDFATAFEAAYQLNDVQQRRSSLSSVTDKAAVATETTAVEKGWLVAVRVDVGYSYPSGGETPQTVHADYTAYASYFVGEDRAVRVETSPSELVDSREAFGGAIVACSS